MPTPKQRPTRSAGVLLHPTSLPGPFGIGDLGPGAYAWVNALVQAPDLVADLPLGPTGYGDSPYQSFAAFAGNPYLVSPELLVRDGLVGQHDLGGVHFPAMQVDYGPVIHFKLGLLLRCWENFRGGAAPGLRQDFEAFCDSQANWLEDFALFMALKNAHGGSSWLSWPTELVMRQPAALQAARGRLEGSIGLQKFSQFLFFRQWWALKGYANSRGVRLIGDMPIFVSSDSVDVWAHPDLFLLDPQRRPMVVAGVPPDYFSATGQLWGNPLYNWDRLRQTGYAWWVARLRTTLTQVDLVRLDHFRGFEAYWEVPAGMTTAEHGRWVRVPGDDLFARLREALRGLPLVAEDLGLITPEVEALRARLDLPGMRVLHFAFHGDVNDRYLPHNYDHNTLVYTGTHDNDTTRGWYTTLSDDHASFLRRYLPGGVQDVSWDLIRLAWSSVADYAVTPLQDVLGLGTEARMNQPGRPAGNWGWRFTLDQVNPGLLERLAEFTTLYSR